jgi:hypothetical protein
MACRDVQQSAVRECRDQLFLDTADDIRLNVLTSNFGLDRPAIGTGDDEWRALAKVVALQPKQVRNIFYRLLETCVGPQKTRVAYITETLAVGDTTFTISNPENIIQVGTLIFSPGLSEEESVDFCYRDLITGKVFLSTALTQTHATLAVAQSYLNATTNATATSLVLVSTADFPTSGFPYSVLLDEGTETEEIVVVTANNTGTNTLTLNVGTQFTHLGSKPLGFIRKPLNQSSIAGRIFIRLATNATRVFPATGFVRINFGGGSEEVTEYTSNDVSLAVLSLKKPLQNTHTAGESVELVQPGTIARTAPVIQKGINWHVHETEPRKVKICVPEEILERRLVDASFLHQTTPSSASTTLLSAGNVGDTTLHVTSTASFRAGVAALQAPGPDYLEYGSIADATHFTLSFPLASPISNGATVSQVQINYTSTSLDEGNLRTSSGGIESKPEWSGPYIYDANDYGVTMRTATLAVSIPPAAEVAVNQTVGHTCLEVKDVSLWPAPPFSPFLVRIGKDTGFSEDRDCTDRTLKKGLNTTVSSPATAGVTTAVHVANASGFPASSDSVHPAGYRLLLAAGTIREEIVTVDQNDEGVAPGIFTLTAAVTLNKNNGDTVTLLNDVLTTDVLLQPHVAQKLDATKPYPGNSPGHSVDVIHTTITASTGSGFDTAGTLWLNFGRSRLKVRAKIKTVISSTVLEFDNSSIFPTTDFPYQIIVGQGRANEELAFVTINNTGTNRLTVSGALTGTFAAGQYVEFISGAPLAVQYVSVDGAVFTLDQSTIFASRYTLGESVIQSNGFSIPTADGTDYPFRMPPAPVACVANMIDLVRAAGVEVTILDRCLKPKVVS